MRNSRLQIRFRDSRLGPSLERPCPLTLPDDDLPALVACNSNNEHEGSSVSSSSDCSDWSHASHVSKKTVICASQRTPTIRMRSSASLPSPSLSSRRQPRLLPTSAFTLHENELRHRHQHPSYSLQRQSSLARFHQQHAQVVAANQVWIEIAPGVTTRLRGAQETWQCVENDAYQPTQCLGCNQRNLFCMDTAQFVLCPHCKVISPIDKSGGNSNRKGEEEEEGGVGLGFTMENLHEWQNEIVQQRQQLARS